MFQWLSAFRRPPASTLTTRRASAPDTGPRARYPSDRRSRTRPSPRLPSARVDASGQCFASRSAPSRESWDNRYAGIASPAPIGPNIADCTTTWSDHHPRVRSSAADASRGSYSTPVYRSIAGSVGAVSSSRFRRRSSTDRGPSFRAVRAVDSSELTERAAVITAARSSDSSGKDSAPRSRARAGSPPSRFVSDGGRRTVSPVRTPARPGARRS
ncbi:hypothetical protein Cus16_0181 [Curtobacterium sp. ER1/6]|nr:hypothetical protein Cus16_0181 [Curtobacterium sp. ER1/6]